MIPRPVIAVVEAARKVVRARKRLSEAVAAGETNDAGIARLRRELQQTVKALVKAVDELEALLARVRTKRGASKTFPWTSFFDAAGKFVDLAAKVRSGDPNVVREAARFVGDHGPGRATTANDDIVDGEFTEVE